MSLYKLVVFLKASTNTKKSFDFIKELQFNNQFNYINGPNFSKRNDYNITPFKPNSFNTKSEI